MLKVDAKYLGSAAVLCLHGQMVNGETEVLRNSVDLISEVDAVILDLAHVTTLDAHGLGVMLDLRRRALERGIPLELMNVRQPLIRILEMTRLDTVFAISSGVEFFPAGSRDQQAKVFSLRSCA